MQAEKIKGIPAFKSAVYGGLGIDKYGNGAKGALTKASELEFAEGAFVKARQGRKTVKRLADAQGVACDGTLAYVDGGRLYYGGDEIEGVYLSEGEKTLLRVGGYLLVFPDGIFVDLASGETGRLAFTVSAPYARMVTVDRQGNELDHGSGTRLPDTAAAGEYFALQGSDGAFKMKRYNGVYWSDEQCFIKIEGQGLGATARVGDTLRIEGAQVLGSTVTVVGKEPDAIFCEGVISGETITLGSVTLCREIPVFDLVTVSGGRVCGVRRGRDGYGEIVCRMYVSAPFDPFNFLPEGGGAMLDLDLSGEFTAVADRDGEPLAFTEGELIEARVRGGVLSATVIKTLGTVKGAHKSVCCADGDVYYLSPEGICVYDGSYPRLISGGLGRTLPTDGSAAVLSRGRYRVSVMLDGQKCLAVYSVGDRRFLTESDPGALTLFKHRENAYALCKDGRIVLLDTGRAEETEYLADEAEPEGDFGFILESAPFGELGGSVCPIRLTLDVKKPEGAPLSAGLLYGDGQTCMTEITERVDGQICVPVALKRDGSFKVRLEGRGECLIRGYCVEMRREGAVLWK